MESDTFHTIKGCLTLISFIYLKGEIYIVTHNFANKCLAKKENNDNKIGVRRNCI